MKAVGIVAEYNPFHNGHKYNLEAAKKKSGADCVIAVMSGSFCQRGEPAVFSKHARAEMAVLGGADIVFELPSYFALKSAGGFAKGGIALLKAAGVSSVAFGAECDDIGALKETSKVIRHESCAFKESLKKSLKDGASFAAARANALREFSPQSAEILKSPNNILACEYIAAMEQTGFEGEAYAVKRRGVYHDAEETDGCFASASYIRRALQNGEDVLPFVPGLPDEKPVFLEDYEKLILYSLKIKESIKDIPDTSDGLAERIMSISAGSLKELLDTAKAKRFAMSRIKRVLMNILIKNNLPKDLEPSYLRILALNDTGTAYLKEIKDNCPLPLITKPALYKTKDSIFELELRASGIRSIISGGKPDITVSPVKI
ncbi:MAG: nucleotidyltransferase family protein [Clostridia bacterium]|nr:nucleotidyltransferase family protein [Clostridia bacterium]